MVKHDFKFGTRVAYTREFLRNTGQFTGPEAPISYGPFARGTAIVAVPIGNDRNLVTVHWDDGHANNVLDANLVPVDRLHLEPV